jgi:DNA-binding winged helix-turn-helix (wHTH) protein
MSAGSQLCETVFKFENFELIPTRRLLMRDGRAVKIGSRAFDLLVALVERAGNVVGKNDLFVRVWAKLVVEESNLRVHIACLRRLLGDDYLESRYIVHVATQGYIFVVPVCVTNHTVPRGSRARRVGLQSSLHA